MTEFKIKFDMTDCDTLEKISNLQLRLLESKKSILEELKNSDKTLSAKIFKDFVKNVQQIFTDLATPIAIRKRSILREYLATEKVASKIKKVGVAKTTAINDKFNTKILKYDNWLFYFKRRKIYKADKRALKFPPTPETLPEPITESLVIPTESPPANGSPKAPATPAKKNKIPNLPP
jgi:hypothetical protein